ncbi:MAG: phosphatase PAP2 family protein [Nanoarchaeota archaeon]|nr:phosphatase PAP2 family protein [Nanoarchaeota archaeon]
MKKPKILKKITGKPIFTNRVIAMLALVLLALIISLFFDKTLFSALFSVRISSITSFFVVLTDARVLITVMYVIPCVYMLKDKRRNYIPFILGSLAISFAFSHLLKLGIERIRPFLTLDVSPILFEQTFSFPSNHATVAFAAIPILYFLFKQVKYLFLAFAILLAYSRIYLGVHYLSDVLAGVLLGLLIGYFMWYFKDQKVNDYSKEVKRQVLHAIWGSLTVLLLFLNYINVVHIVMIIIVGLILSYIATKRKVIIINWFLENFDRRSAIPGVGAITFFVGILVSIILFSRPVTVVSPIALASIMVLTLGDSAATFFGIRFGKRKNPLNKKKTVEGTLAGMIFGFLGAMLFVPWYIALPGAVIAMLVEAIEGEAFKFSDNIAVPLVAGVVMGLILRVF